MDSPCSTQEADQAYREAARESAETNPKDVSMMVEVRGDARKLFVALTEPEFIEAWMSLPGTPSLNPVASRDGADVQFQLFDRGGSVHGMTWRNIVYRRRKIAFSWIRFLPTGTSESKVNIRLLGNFGSTFVDLTHKGIRSDDEHEWYQDLWTRSLARLSQLMQAPGAY